MKFVVFVWHVVHMCVVHDVVTWKCGSVRQLEISYIDNSSRKFDLKKDLKHMVLEMHKHNLQLGFKGVQLPFDPEAQA